MINVFSEFLSKQPLQDDQKRSQTVTLNWVGFNPDIVEENP